MITQASGLAQLRSSTGRGRKQSHLPKGCVLKDNRKQNQLHNWPDSLQNADMGSLFKVCEEFQDGGNSFKPCVGPFLAQDREPAWIPSPWSWPLQAGGTWLHCYLWFSGSSWSISIWGFFAGRKKQEPLWFLLLSTSKWTHLCSHSDFYPLPVYAFYTSISSRFSLSNSLRERVSERGELFRFIHSYPEWKDEAPCWVKSSWAADSWSTRQHINGCSSLSGDNLGLINLCKSCGVIQGKTWWISCF